MHQIPHIHRNQEQVNGMQLAPKKKNQESAAQSRSAIKSVISNGRQLKVIRGKNGEIILTGVKPGQQLLIVKNDGSSKFITIPKQLDFKKPVKNVKPGFALFFISQQCLPFLLIHLFYAEE